MDRFDKGRRNDRERTTLGGAAAGWVAAAVVNLLLAIPWRAVYRGGVTPAGASG